jgi:hypothetical protein
MKTQKSYKMLQAFSHIANGYLIKNGYIQDNKYTDKEPTKLVLNIKTVLKDLETISQSMMVKIDNLGIDLCLEDPITKAVLYNEKGGYQYTKENLKIFNAKARDLSDSLIDIDARITEGELSLTNEEKEYFSGIVIP